ncbi:MAG: sel1 repeat family protein [Desulfovibrionaceae bacterium]|nr:sel1 repeat family protein [Desulfovibrionaceae bacterium]
MTVLEKQAGDGSADAQCAPGTMPKPGLDAAKGSACSNAQGFGTPSAGPGDAAKRAPFRPLNDSWARQVQAVKECALEGGLQIRFSPCESCGPAGGAAHDCTESAGVWFKKAGEPENAPCEPENAAEQLALGEKYYSGRGVLQNLAKAALWYQKAAAQGHPEAQCRLGEMYENGHGVPKDLAAAAEWYKRSAEQGHAKAQNHLGCMHCNG